MKTQYDSESFRKGKEALGKIGLLILSFAAIFGLFRLIIFLSLYFEAAWIYYVGTTVYALAGVASIIAFFVLNGFSFGKELRTADDLPDGWDDERKTEFLENQPENKKKARKLIYIILPLAVTMAVSYVELFIIG
mgnify:CR=1 FL=1